MHGSLTKRYAKALLILAIEQDQVDPFRQQLQQFLEVAQQSPILLETLSNQTLDPLSRKRVLQEVLAKFQFDKRVNNFLYLLLDKRRIHLFAEMYQTYCELADEHQGLMRAEVFSAAPLGDMEQKEIQKQLERISSRKVKVQFEVDESLIGGVKTKIGNQVIDGTLITQLHNLRKQACTAQI